MRLSEQAEHQLSAVSMILAMMMASESVMGRYDSIYSFVRSLPARSPNQLTHPGPPVSPYIDGSPPHHPMPFLIRHCSSLERDWIRVTTTSAVPLFSINSTFGGPYSRCHHLELT